MAFRHLFSDRQRNILAYCAEEVRRQQDTPVHVAYMVNAWDHAWVQSVGRGRPLSPGLIQEIGALVAPQANLDGFRRVGVRVGGDVKMDWQTVPRAIETLCEAWNEGRIDGFTHSIAGEVGPAERFYFEFLQIHPFKDGNGRSAKVILAMITSTLDNPRWPSNFWNIGNP